MLTSACFVRQVNPASCGFFFFIEERGFFNVLWFFFFFFDPCPYRTNVLPSSFTGASLSGRVISICLSVPALIILSCFFNLLFPRGRPKCHAENTGSPPQITQRRAPLVPRPAKGGCVPYPVPFFTSLSPPNLPANVSPKQHSGREPTRDYLPLWLLN